MHAKLPEQLRLDRLATPIGEALLVTDTQGHLHALDWTDYEHRLRQLLRLHYGAVALSPGAAPQAMRAALDAYFAGELGRLDEISWRTAGTEFQRSVWQALTRIPVGETRSYGELAAAIGRPKAVRAVGAVNGANPVSIVVPCHRVSGADGILTCYGGGLLRKRWLLAHEGARFRDIAAAA